MEESKDFQLKGPVNIFIKTTEENLPKLKKEMPMNIHEAYRIPNRLGQKRNYKERILNAVRDKCQKKKYKGSPIRITKDFSPDYKNQKILVRSHTSPKRGQLPAQAPIPRKTLNYHRWRKQDIP